MGTASGSQFDHSAERPVCLRRLIHAYLPFDLISEWLCCHKLGVCPFILLSYFKCFAKGNASLCVSA